ncbi:MAG: hypothetical protein HN855_03205 [Anaerolineae bacterium]|jgi:hypothetical protein|nr:hypothetical protein [Anaerolineae bacterium]MBT7071344.1 hypothetical protein [Anaerolineae bacterium]MBT7324146.1 hypothetical protein [Anaerolineae bacterium]
MTRIAFILLIISILLGACAPSPQAFNTSFPSEIDPDARYLFYLHGKIIEDQGLPAISPEYGEYQYHNILKTFAKHDFVIISEEREKDTDGVAYAKAVEQQIKDLLEAGVPARNITVVGASKGSYIAIFTSYFLKESEVKFVLLGSCSPSETQNLIDMNIHLYGNILSIYDFTDPYAGSCNELFSFSEGKGIDDYNEIVLDIGTGHGILYQPLDEWVLPTLNWAKQ